MYFSLDTRCTLRLKLNQFWVRAESNFLLAESSSHADPRMTRLNDISSQFERCHASGFLRLKSSFGGTRKAGLPTFPAPSVQSNLYPGENFGAPAQRG